jgi:O-antigen ligase
LKSGLRNVAAWSANNTAFILLLLTLALFSSKSLYNIPVMVMALLGIRRLISDSKTVFASPQVRLFTGLFLALWLPQLLSLPDAVSLEHTAGTALPYLRFLFMGIYVLTDPGLASRLPQLQKAIFWIAVFWSVDAVIQYVAGVNLFGYPYETGHITGMFYPDNTITHVLAALSPLYFETLREYSRRFPAAWLLILPLFAVVLLGGRRAAWIMLAISVCGYLYYLYRYTDSWAVSRKRIALAALSCLLLFAALILSTPTLQERLVTTAGLFSLDYELTDQATARRLPIWMTAIEVIKHNPINGIGPRGFRHVYRDYSTPDNYFHEIGTTHPHQLVLEIAAECGLFGIAGLLFFVYLFWTRLLTPALKPVVIPAALAILIIMFPFSAGLAFYGSYWSSVIWWFVLFALLCPQRRLQ